MDFYGLPARSSHELPDFTHFSCVLAHEYFGDLASGKIFTETNWRPSVSTRGRGTSGYSNLNGGFSGLKEPTQQILPDFTHFSCVLAHEYFGDLASGKIFTETNWRPSVSTRGRGYVGLQRFKWGFSGLNEPMQQELPDFTHFSCVLVHEYFGDLASGKIFTETNCRPSVSTRGRGYVGLQRFKWGFSGLNEPMQQELPDFTHFSCVLVHEYFGDLASGKIFTETNCRPSVSTRGR